MKKIITSAIIGAAAIGGIAFTIANNNSPAIAGETEKCYGVAKAEANDCGSKTNGHSCAGQSKMDSDGNEFIAIPKGLCERLTNGNLNGDKS